MQFNKKNKTNPLLTPMPKELANCIIKNQTKIPNDIKPYMCMNLSLIKKIKVKYPLNIRNHKNFFDNKNINQSYFISRLAPQSKHFSNRLSQKEVLPCDCI